MLPSTAARILAGMSNLPFSSREQRNSPVNMVYFTTFP